MRLLISDANILIDMEAGALMETLFQLPMQFGIPDLLYYEEIEPGSPGLEELGLQVMEVIGDFLTTHSLPVPDGFAWDDTPETSQFLVEAVKVWPDIAARDRMTANLMASVQLGDAAGKQAMFEAAVADAAALAGLALLWSSRTTPRPPWWTRPPPSSPSMAAACRRGCCPGARKSSWA